MFWFPFCIRRRACKCFKGVLNKEIFYFKPFVVVFHTFYFPAWVVAVQNLNSPTWHTAATRGMIVLTISQTLSIAELILAAWAPIELPTWLATSPNRISCLRYKKTSRYLNDNFKSYHPSGFFFFSVFVFRPFCLD